MRKIYPLRAIILFHLFYFFFTLFRILSNFIDERFVECCVYGKQFFFVMPCTSIPNHIHIIIYYCATKKYIFEVSVWQSIKFKSYTYVFFKGMDFEDIIHYYFLNVFSHCKSFLCAGGITACTRRKISNATKNII